jgi:diguanylate cyclase (GGDEF)-like protein
MPQRYFMQSLHKQQTNLLLASEADRAFATSLMDYLVVPTFVLDAKSRVLIWNKACERLTGFQASELIGTSDHWRAFYKEKRPCLVDLVVERRFKEISTLYVSGGGVGYSDFGVSAENWCVMPKLGRLLYLAIDAGPIYDEGGKLVAAVETLRDITVQKEAQTQLESLATRDGLTGLPNRRSFDERLTEEARRSTRDRRPLSLLMIDIDYFKPYNDTYGHQKGDECLRTVARAIEGALWRASDFAARYGGEEFAVVMPDTSLAGAVLMAERLLKAVEDLRLDHVASGAVGRVSVSIGGVAALAPDLLPAKLIECADAALYRAKRDGRNRTSLSPLAAAA